MLKHALINCLLVKSKEARIVRTRYAFVDFHHQVVVQYLAHQNEILLQLTFVFKNERADVKGKKVLQFKKINYRFKISNKTTDLFENSFCNMVFC